MLEVEFAFMPSVEAIIAPKDPSASLRRFARLLEPKTDTELETMAQESAVLTRRNFGKAIRLFAPLYLATSASTTAPIAASPATTRSCA